MAVCGECIYLNWNNKKTSSIDQRRCECPNCEKYVKPTDSSCRYFIKKEKAQTGCFITTVVVDVLGYSDDCWILKTLRDFRNNIMQKDYRFSKLLLSYDVIGPKIAAALREAPAKEEISLVVSQLYLIPMCRLINSEDYMSAVNSYVGMVKFLQNQLLVTEELANYQYDESVKEEEKGHGRALIKLVTE